MKATITYYLSKEGQRAALVAGHDAAEKQTILDAEVPADLARFVDIDKAGRGTLALSSCEVWGAEWPAHLFDAPMTAAEAIAALAQRLTDRAAEEKAAEAKREAERLEQRAAGDAWLDAIEPVLEHCGRKGPYEEIATDTPEARAIIERIGITPPRAASDEARLERVRKTLLANGEAFKQREREQRERELELEDRAERERAEAKAKTIADWVAAHGDENQRARFAAGMLPEGEAIAAIADAVFSAVSLPPYKTITAADCRAAAPGLAEEFDAYDDPHVYVKVEDSRSATAAQWEALETVRKALPGAEIRLRRHRAGLTDDLRSDDCFRWSILAKVRLGGLTVVRAFAAPDGAGDED
jgi:hypothetical protein